MATTDYFKKWYKENREAHNAARKKRYNQDSEYREQAKESVRKYREVSAHKPVYKYLDGKRVNAYPIQHAAYIVEREVITVQSWIDKGFIPHPTVKDEARAYFTSNQIKWMKKLARELSVKRGDRKYASREELSAEIEKHWND